jgi:hypothetical protein
MRDELYQIFSKYKTDVFIETGTYRGDSIIRALDIGYKQIHSIEINFDRYEYCVDMFRNDEKVHLRYGDSLMQLPVILENIDQKCTFWLDAHMSQISRNCPTLEELKIIGQHHIKDHIILIDDMQDFGTQAHEGITIQDLQSEILKINFDYKFSFESTSIENNVLVCQI